jgi:hypothetical protein
VYVAVNVGSVHYRVCTGNWGYVDVNVGCVLYMGFVLEISVCRCKYREFEL